MKSLEEKNEEFILNILHDIKSPILSINIALNSLTNKDELLNEVYKINLHNLNYIDNLVENYSIKEGKYSLKYEYFNLIEILNDEIFSLRFMILEKNLSINISYNNSEIFVKSDKHIVRQAFLNLVTNAVKYSPVGSEVKIELTKVTQGVLACFTNSLSKENKKGTGIGSSIIKGALEMLDGKINSTKTKDKICFYIEIPNR